MTDVVYDACALHSGWRLIQIDPKRVLQAVKSHRLSLTRPPKTVDEYLTTLEKQGLIKTVAFLREHWNAI